MGIICILGSVRDSQLVTPGFETPKGGLVVLSIVVKLFICHWNSVHANVLLSWQ